MQRIEETAVSHIALYGELIERKIVKFFLVYDPAMKKHVRNDYRFNNLARFEAFNRFSPNPLYEEVMAGLKKFRKSGAQAIVALGGGSCIDVAKCIKLYNGKPDLPLFAIPTTAGTGSESTRFAVIYKDGVKQSITDPCIVPDIAYIDPMRLRTLPEYQRKSGALDALCHAVESLWSVNATEESRDFAREALGLMRDNLRGFVAENRYDYRNLMQWAANFAGRAINISQTTAAHAMSYKLTSLFHIAHGHAAALCLPEVMDYLEEQGGADLKALIAEIRATIDVRGLLNELQMEVPQATDEEIEILVSSVNPTRLANSPVPLSVEVIRQMYRNILK